MKEKRPPRRLTADQQALVEQNQGLVWMVVNRLWPIEWFRRGFGDDLQAAVAAGEDTLIKAALNYNPNLGWKFSTYATASIKREFTKHSGRSYGPVYLPPHVALAVYRRRNGEPTDMPSHLADAAERIYQQPIPIADAGNSGDVTATYVEDRRALNDPAAMAERNEEAMASRLRLQELFRCLTKTQRKVLAWRYGLEDGIPRTQREIAAVLRVSSQRVQQLEYASIRLLRKAAGMCGELSGIPG